jgi:hypothetical protein
MGDRKVAYRGNLIGKKSLVSRRRKWVDNIRMDVTEIDWEAVDRIDLARDGQVEGYCKCGDDASGSIKCGKLLD